ncbi:MAG TPA: ion transporter [Flavisolibacter sp.]|jgi:voltage-gated potassium channel|nr:ion transporter [Flavisolibacter sp.]
MYRSNSLSLYGGKTFASALTAMTREPSKLSWQDKLHEIIYESHTPAGKLFDVALLLFILISIAVVMLDSVPELHSRYGELFYTLEWIFTALFTIEYILRLLSIRKPLSYATSFLGIIDLLAIIPTYLSVFVVGAQSLLVLRGLRLLRVFRIFKLTHFLSEMAFLGSAMRASLKKIFIFMLIVLTLVVILGSVMYLVEGGESGFRSIPESIYWSIVTITTVGYGDITPVTSLGKFIASLIMFIGYSIIAVPTGIVTSEMVSRTRFKGHNPNVCPACGREGHDAGAAFCKWCGAKL